MQTGRTQTIGVMIPPRDSFWIGVLSGIHSTLAAADYLPITVWVGDAQAFPPLADEDREGVAQISRLLDRRVDGLILWPPFAVAYYDHFRELIERKVPVAVIDHEFSAEGIADSIETDEEQGTAETARHLLHLGHRRIACLSTAETSWQAWAVRRRGHFELAVARHPEGECRSWRVGVDVDQARQTAREMLTGDWRPSAVFAVTDHEALLVYQVAEQLGLRIPDDLSVVGFADLDFSASLSPPLTTVRQKPKEIGRQAARLVIDRLEGLIESDDATTIRVGTEFVKRGSTAPVATAKTT
jgi:LacI family transcriptional regulator